MSRDKKVSFETKLRGMEVEIEGTYDEQDVGPCLQRFEIKDSEGEVLNWHLTELELENLNIALDDYLFEERRQWETY